MVFLRPTFNKSVKQNNPLMQLHWVFHKRVNKIKLKIWKFIGIDLVVFQQLRKRWLESKRGWGNFILFLSLFLSVHKLFNINIFIVTVNLFSSINLLIFCRVQFHCFSAICLIWSSNKLSSLIGSAWFCA